MVNGSRGVVPIDLVAIAVLCGLVTLFSVQNIGPAAIRAPLGFAFVILAPGYALAAVLFPYERRQRNGWVIPADQGDKRSRITFVERIVISAGLSLAIVPLTGLLLGYTQWGFNPTALTAAIAILTVILSIAATVRRWAVPTEKRFTFPVLSAPTQLAAFIGEPRTAREETLAVVVILGLVISTAGIGFAATVPDNGERYTEFYIQGQDPESGEFEPDAYPEEWGAAESVDMVVGLTNQEGETVSYTIVVQQQQLSPTSDGYQVSDRTELDRIDVTAGAGETWREQLELTPTESSDDARIAYLLYVGEPPEEPTADTAYRTVHLSASGVPNEAET